MTNRLIPSRAVYLLLGVGVFASCLVPSRAVAAEGFGIVPESFSAGTFTSEGATGPLGEGAAFDTQAGDHPYEQRVSFEIPLTGVLPDGDLRDTTVELPPGLVGDPNATPQCLPAVLTQTARCPNDTVVGVARVRLYLGGIDENPQFLPVYNMVPSTGQLALLEFHITQPGLNIPIHISVRDTGDYGLTASVTDVSQVAPPFASTVTLWGVPADASHDSYRGTCVVGGSCPSTAPARAFLTNPSVCSGNPLVTALQIDSWEEPAVPHSAAADQPPLGGCGRLLFDPSLEVTPESTAVDTPTGLHVDLHLPQSEDPYALSTPDLRDATVTLPTGVAIAPGGGNGLEGCSPEEVGLHTDNPVLCPDGSKLGTVRVLSPDLPRSSDGSEGELTGAVYLGEPSSGFIASPPYTIYLVVEGYGVSIRLTGTVTPNPRTGALTTAFVENPPLPFEDLIVDFFGGPRAALATPPTCGPYTTTSALTPYSGTIAATPSSTFAASWDGRGATCPNPLPFGPSFGAGSMSATADGFTSFMMNISRADGQQALSQISLTTPRGLLGMLPRIPLCGEPQAADGACPAASHIGTATVATGAGPEPLTVTGPVYLTGPYKDAPFGLSVAIPAIAGPFNFGTVIVRSAIYVDPRTAQITVLSDPLPQMLDTAQTDSGIPIGLQRVAVDIDRPGFIFNPTSCEPTSVTGSLASTRGARSSVSSPFQVRGCQTLQFKPTVTVSTQAKTSRATGAGLIVKVTASSGQANIAKVDVSLPHQLVSRLTTLQRACSDTQFATNPAGCPAGSVVGVATAVTPVLAVPLTGPAILVAHGGAAFPDLVVVLQGQGVTVELVGNTDIKRGITSSKFDSLPDAPISSFELRLPPGPDSLLASNLPAKAKGSMCAQKLAMPTVLTGQNGTVVDQSTRIVVPGCDPSKQRKPRRTRAHGRRRRQG